MGNKLERKRKVKPSNFDRKRDSPCYDTSVNQNTNSHSNSLDAELRTYTQNVQNLRGTDSNCVLNRLSGELNQRRTQEMGDFMSTVSSHIQRAINEAISDQMLPQIQATIESGQGRMPERGWEVPVRGQGCRSEDTLDRRFRRNLPNVFPRFPNRNENLEITHDIKTGDNESPNLDPEYLTGRSPSRTALIQHACDNIGLLDTTIATSCNRRNLANGRSRPN